MFRFFERLVDPYVGYREADAPPTRVWPFLRDYSRPFHRVFAWTAFASVLIAAVELWLIDYLGRVVDLLAGEPAEVWAAHGPELILVALFILFVRPVLQAVGVLLLNQSVMPNYGTLIRWRAHRHVLRQSVGWFEDDLAGRIANRIMQTPPAAGEVVFQLFDAILRRRRPAARRGRRPADAAAPDLARALRLPRRMDHPARRTGLQSLVRCAVRGHGACGRRLHQHPLRQALRAQ